MPCGCNKGKTEYVYKDANGKVLSTHKTDTQANAAKIRAGNVGTVEAKVG